LRANDERFRRYFGSSLKLHGYRVMLRLSKDVKWRLGWRIGALVGLIVLSITALLAVSIVRAQKDALAQARLQASYLSAGLEQDAEDALGAVAVASEFVKRRVDAEGSAAPLAEMKHTIAKYIPHLINISVIGPNGRLVATSGDMASSPADFSQFDFFIANRDSTGSGFRIGKPTTGHSPRNATP
jgi:hypothetical protein